MKHVVQFWPCLESDHDVVLTHGSFSNGSAGMVVVIRNIVDEAPLLS
jgi:hypothetical protein